MQNADFSRKLREVAGAVSDLEGELVVPEVDLGGFVFRVSGHPRGPLVEPDPKVFVYCDSRAAGGIEGVTVEDFKTALTNAAKWLEDLAKTVDLADKPDATVGSL